MCCEAIVLAPISPHFNGAPPGRLFVSFQSGNRWNVPTSQPFTPQAWKVTIKTFNDRTERRQTIEAETKSAGHAQLPSIKAKQSKSFGNPFDGVLADPRIFLESGASEPPRLLLLDETVCFGHLAHLRNGDGSNRLENKK
jgi:hypothetical protein